MLKNLSIIALAAFSCVMFILGLREGETRADTRIAEYEQQIRTQREALQRLNTQASARIVTEYVDRVRIVREKEYVYVSAAQNDVPSQYDLSSGWVYLHDASVRGDDPDPSRVTDASPSGIADNLALAVVTGNYATCREISEQLIALQEWVRSSSAND